MASPTEAKVPEPAGQERVPTAGRPQVLVVDDDPGVQLTLARALARFGYEVFLAGSGTDALAHLVHQPDIVAVLSDVDMAPMNGVELARQVQHLRAGMPLLFLTSDPNIINLRHQPQVGVLTKPIDLDDLQAAIETVVSACR